jgi:hypothetical protein
MIKPPSKLRPLLPVILLFTFLTGFLLTQKNFLENKGINREVVIIGNLILFAITIGSWFISLRGLKAANPNVFVRSMYLNLMLKLFVCMIAAFVYIFTFKKELNKPALFICMGLYFVYTFIEVAALTKLLKQKKNA